VYSSELNAPDIDAIKEVINAHCGTGIDEVGITLEGFKAMQVLLIQTKQIDLCWKTLEAFNFSPSLQLNTLPLELDL
jgi:hypothetical protein